MTDIEKQIEELSRQLADLRTRHVVMKQDMLMLERKLEGLGTVVSSPVQLAEEVTPAPVQVTEEVKTTANFTEERPYIQQAQERVQQQRAMQQPLRAKKEMEDFIGTDVISKVGILITIIGVFIGAKYAIDKELISPSMRIVAGYLAAGVLVFLAFRLKKKYLHFSAILMGGGLAVTYFITYIAYSYYQLFPHLLAFALMLITTAAAVAIALWYNQKIIALLGQVAAYAIPFLLSNNSGNVFALFSYISLINAGLVILSFRKDWKLLYHIGFFTTWFIYLFWITEEPHVKEKFSTGVLFLAVNFFTFYVTFLSYKVYKKELYKLGEIVILFINALLFFFLGYYIIEESFTNPHYLTYFTIANAVIHFIAGYFIYRLQLADKSVFQFIAGLGLLFVTVAIPIELDGSWVTLLWAVEATTVFTIAYANGRSLYLDLAIPLVCIALFSLLQDWLYMYPYLGEDFVTAKDHAPFAHINFYLSLVVSGSFGYMSVKGRETIEGTGSLVAGFFKMTMPLVFIAVLYFALFNEIHYFYDRKMTIAGDNINLEWIRAIVLFIYTFVYLTLCFRVNAAMVRSRRLYNLFAVAGAFANIVFLLFGLYAIGELRDSYIAHSYSFGELVLTRYLLIAALSVLWITALHSARRFDYANTRQLFSVLFNITLLAVISNEFIHWMDIAGYQNQYKLGLSLICGAYALALIFVGIIRRKKHLRVFAIMLFGSTLVKLFFYDLSSLSTISKTIVMVLLGVLLLIASFLYNKYKEVLFANEDNKM